MNKNIENIDKYLKAVVPPEHISHQHRQQLRREVLEKIERRQNMSVRRSWKVAAVIAVVLGLGAISVVGVNIGRYYYFGQNKEGDHIFISDDGGSVVTMDDEDVTNIEQTQDDLQEMKLLSQDGKRELVRVIRTDVNGRLERRLFVYKYELPDGRTKEMGEAAPDNAGEWILNEKQWEEMMQLKKGGPGENLGTYEEQVLDRTFEFNRQRYILSDGTEVIWSVGTPKDGR